MNNPLWFISLGFAFLIWLIIFVFLLRILVLGIKSRSWYGTEGKIVHSEIRKISRSETGAIIDQYRTTIKYRYRVKDAEYESGNISFGDLAWYLLGRGLKSQNSAKKIVRKYPPEKSVKVFYNPGNPKQAVLETGIINFYFLVIFLTVIVMGAFLSRMLFLLFFT